MNKFIFTLLLLQIACTTIVFSQILPDPESLPEKYFPSQKQVIKLGDIKPLRDIAPHKSPQTPPSAKTWTKSNYFKSNELRNPHPEPQGGDPLAAASLKSDGLPAAPEITPGLNFEGLGDLSGVTPPDPVGDALALELGGGQSPGVAGGAQQGNGASHDVSVGLIANVLSYSELAMRRSRCADTRRRTCTRS